MHINARRRAFIASILCAATLHSFSAFSQASGPRYALVIGNGNYSELSKLKNPANDATDIAKALKALGFKDVKLLVDSDLPTMEDAVDRLGAELSQTADSVGFFFYAGHGVQSGGINYLIPADAHIPTDAYLKTKALPAQIVMETLQGSRNALNIVVLDACRDNPFSWGRSASRGLSVVASQPPGSIVAYATSAGSVAQDGTGRNGVFTTELLKQIGTPGLEIKDMFNRTGKAVSQATAGKQVPAIYNQFFDSAYLAGPLSAGASAAQTASAAPAAEAPSIVISRSYGGLVINAATAGELFIDGAKMGDLPDGAKATMKNIEVGDRSVELRYADGKIEKRSAAVSEGQVIVVSFNYKKSAPPPAAALNVESPRPGFVLAPGGSFMMGSPRTEPGRYNDEEQHQVTLSSFAISVYDVTFDEYDEYCAATKARKPDDEGWGRGSRPVVNVTWFDAVSYCNWRSKKEKKKPAYSIGGKSVSCDWDANGYRLPTEAEWEYAARGGPAASSLSQNASFAGSADPGDVAWYNDNSGNQTHPVGQKAPNALGLYDMAGNVWQWCWDLGGTYTMATQVAPKGPNHGENRICRGGSWILGPESLRSAMRGNNNPDTWNNRIGFRVVFSH